MFKVTKHICFIMLVLFSLTLMQCNNTTTNWRENYREFSKSPFGTYIIFNEAEESLFKGDSVILLQQHIYDYLIETNDYDIIPTNYVTIKDKLNTFNYLSLDALLDYVSEGNNVFLSLNTFPETLTDTLQVKTNNLNEYIYEPQLLKALKGDLFLSQEKFKNQAYYFDRNLRQNYFSEYNTSTSVVLGTQNVEGIKHPVFLKIDYGNGSFFLHSQPIVFTNYFMINDKQNYAENVLSYLPDRNKLLWDTHTRFSNKRYASNEDEDSIFKFFLQHPSLKWSLFTMLFGVILFLLFNAKRKQRIIPEISKLKNSTVEFAHSISNLYLKEDNHKNMATKKITYFLEFVRSHFLLDTSNLNDAFKERLAQKTGNTLDSTNYLINRIIDVNNKPDCTEDELVRLNTLIDKFLNPN